MFSGSPKGAKVSAATLSLIETAKANNLDLYDYIEYLLEMIPNMDIVYHSEEIDNYLPWSNQIQSLFKCTRLICAYGQCFRLFRNEVLTLQRFDKNWGANHPNLLDNQNLRYPKLF